MQSLRKVPGATPFFIAAFLNAFVDLGHKIVIQNTVYKLYDGPEQVILTAIVNALILLPFLLLLSPAGFLSDKLYKSQVMRLSAWAAVGLTLAITACYYAGWFELAFAMTFLLAAQSSIYSPAKYGYIKELFGKERLSRANGTVAALSITAILAGSFAFTLVFEVLYPKGATSEAQVLRAIAPLGWLLVFHSIIQLVMMYRLPTVGEPKTEAVFDTKAFLTGQLFARDLKPLSQNRTILLSVIGLAMFWSIGQVLLAAFPSFLKETTGELNTLKVQAVLACSGIGIALGSMIAGRVSRNHIELGLLPVGALGILGGLTLLTHLDSLLTFGLCFLVIGTSGGLFIVPLNALIQFNARSDALGQTLAANNWVQNLAMLSFLVVTAVFAQLNLSSELLLQLMIGVALIGSIYTLKQLPQAFVRFALASVISRRYKVSVQGMRHVPANGGVLLLGNHISWIDWAILQLACPRPVRFVMIKNIYQRWYLKRFLDLMGCIPISQGASAQSSLERVAKHLNNGEVVCLFPEGTISRTGHLAAFRRGFERAAALCNDDVVIVPFYLRGLWGSQFSRAGEHIRRTQKRTLARQLICAFGSPLPKATTAESLKQAVYDLSLIAWQVAVDDMPNIGASWVQRAKQVGSRNVIVAPGGGALSGYRALTLSLIWARKLNHYPAGHIALLLPPSANAAVFHMAAFISGRSLTNLNPQHATETLISQLHTVNAKAIFICSEDIGHNQIIERLSEAALPAAIVDIASRSWQPSWVEHGLTRFYGTLSPVWMVQKLSVASTQPHALATTVFTDYQAVHLSHKNLQANILQITDILNATADDTILTQLPLDQAYGLTVGLLMPLLQGMTCVPQPLDNPSADAKAISKHDVTLLFAHRKTLVQLTQEPKVHNLMLRTLRTVVASHISSDDEYNTEKDFVITDKQCIKDFQLKFNCPVRVGFGLTEASPVISCNIPDAIDTHNWRVQIGEKPHTQGMPLPGTSIKIVDQDFVSLPSGITGRVWVAGPQVMEAELNRQPTHAKAPLTEQHPTLVEGRETNWLDTGMDGFLDDDGFLVLV